MAVFLSQSAQETLVGMPKGVRLRLRAVMAALERWPAVSGVKPLRGGLAGWYRKRTGDYRVVFRVSGADVYVEKIGHRRDVYEE
jgi:mRNA interferase RelE/StbE